jgi:hypothetical protein
MPHFAAAREPLRVSEILTGEGLKVPDFVLISLVSPLPAAGKGGRGVGFLAGSGVGPQKKIGTPLAFGPL